jgi:ABC-type transport system involved in multi-copper enzyme maturation permease subunit
MRPSATAVFCALAGEAFRDAMRRRIVPVIAVFALLSLLAVDSCTSCAGSSQVVQNGEQVSVDDISGWAGMLIFTMLSLWTMVLAGLLASDHLAETVLDGSANLILARPVRRSEFVLARLAGALGIAYVTGAVVLTVSAYLLHLRNGVSLEAAIWAGLACAAGALVVAALAMTLSLLLARIATAMMVLCFVAAITLINAFTLGGMSLGELGSILQHITPPLCTALVLALEPWIALDFSHVDPTIVALKLAFWVIASVLILLATFRRRELGT